MKKNVLVIGSEGQLGSEIKAGYQKVIQADFTFTTIDQLDVTNQQALRELIMSQMFDYIINCTAYTAVDKAESEVELATMINHVAVQTIGECAVIQKSKVIHVSTDYVFDGRNYRPYSEDDQTSPSSVYGQTKLKGEEALLNANADSIIIRTSWLYSSFGNNFVKTMLKLGEERDELKVIFDQIGTPTYAKDLAEVILYIIEKDISKEVLFHPGIFHYSNEGVCSWFDFTKAIHEIAGVNCKVLPIESEEYPTAAPRPHYSVLNKRKLKEVYKIDIPYWKDSLSECIQLIKQ